MKNNIFKERVDMLDMLKSEISEKSLVEEGKIQKLYNGELEFQELDDVEQNFIAYVLECEKEYFTSEEVRNKDLVKNSFNRGLNCVKTNRVKAKLQTFTKDLIFLKEIMDEMDELKEINT